MKINPGIEIENMEGLAIPITEVKGVCPKCGELLNVQSMRGVQIETGKNLTLRDICVNSLMETYPDEKNLSGMEKLRRGKLAEKIFAGTESTDLTPEEMVLTKKLIGLKYGPLFVMRSYELLEGPDSEQVEK